CDHGIAQDLEVFVDSQDAVKFSLLTLKNESRTTRTLSVFFYCEWVLGPPQGDPRRQVVTELDALTGALLASNAYRGDYAGRVAFVVASQPAVSVTGDRTSFLGRNRSLAAPAALGDRQLSGRFGAGLDPCAGLQLRVDLPPGESHSLAVLLGEGEDRPDVLRLIARHAAVDAAVRARAA